MINVVPGGWGNPILSKVDYDKAIVHRIHLESLLCLILTKAYDRSCILRDLNDIRNVATYIKNFFSQNQPQSEVHYQETGGPQGNMHSVTMFNKIKKINIGFEKSLHVDDFLITCSYPNMQSLEKQMPN